ncbi:AraC family transcriptional regulator [Terrisporobacter petrolearius]|uniref:AraC family transcriptional regulator n=1 Tax=Terrisporobacter petrolearius TaxID=1460447 RepID=UPI001D16796A|nr:AraC family transcriptional regulator [Terrisporobacter petrolearius]MCC3865463.1 AraC family transcriptional regulator [Terrisporobacter petrolearius]
MEWIESISKAIEYIETHITEDLTTSDIAKEVCISSFYFQKGFSMLCGFTVAEYIRQRRLTLAGSELVSTDNKIIDIAMKYGYDSPDSFTKAFTRFHGSTPTAVRRDGAMMKSFASLKINISLKGGYTMDYKIIEKEAFTVLASGSRFKYDSCKEEIPKFWQEHYESGKGNVVCGMYGINIDESMGNSDEFKYLIADDYKTGNNIPEGFVTKVIPKHTWAVFSCKGAMPKAMIDVNQKIFSEWLPNCKDYEIAEGYNIETYTDINDYSKGNQDENYYSELWIPVKKKA